MKREKGRWKGGRDWGIKNDICLFACVIENKFIFYFILNFKLTNNMKGNF